MAMNGYSTFPRFPELQPHQQLQVGIEWKNIDLATTHNFGNIQKSTVAKARMCDEGMSNLWEFSASQLQ